MFMHDSKTLWPFVALNAVDSHALHVLCFMAENATK